MFFTERFSTLLRYLFFFVIGMTILTMVLQFFGLHGFSISHPSENTLMRSVMNIFTFLIYMSVLWLAIGYLTQDFKSAYIALAIGITIMLATEYFYPTKDRIRMDGHLIKDISLLLTSVPIAVFGLLHFKSKKGLRLIVFFVILVGLGLLANSFIYTRILSSLLRVVGLDNFYSVEIPIGEGSYRVVPWFTFLYSQFMTVVKIVAFWWVYRLIQSDKSLWNNLDTCSVSTTSSKISFSLFYWSFRMVLIAGSIGLASAIARSFESDFNVIFFIKVGMSIFSLIVIGSIYRNFLSSEFVKNDRYPNGLYLLLNIPLLNVFGWLSCLSKFSFKENEHIISKEKITQTKESFLKTKNAGWKFLFILLVIVSGFVQFLNNNSGESLAWILGGSILSLILVIWFVSEKGSYVPLLVMMFMYILIVTAAREPSFVRPNMVTGFLNIIIFYVLFFFDHLNWDLLDDDQTQDESLVLP